VFILFSRICRSGQFPVSCKLSHVIPVHKKKGSATDLCFYRPIAVLPTLAMVFEDILSHSSTDILSYFPVHSSFSIWIYGRYWCSGLWYCNGIYGYSSIGAPSGMPYSIFGYSWGFRQCMMGWFAEAPLKHWFAK